MRKHKRTLTHTFINAHIYANEHRFGGKTLGDTCKIIFSEVNSCRKFGAIWKKNVHLERIKNG